MAPRKKNAAIKSTGSTSSKAEPLPDWVKNKNIAKPPPKHTISQQASTPSKATGGKTGHNKDAPTASTSEAQFQPALLPRPPPLFPPGTKTPINLLNERIQKHHAPKGWLKPSIEARRAPKGYGDATENGREVLKDNAEHREAQGSKASIITDTDEGERWTFLVTLTKTNKSDHSNPFVVRFDARDFTGHEGCTIILDSKEKAKQWGATYALFRLCSNLSLEQILPTGPREYWKTLLTHKASAPEHLSWLWAADPFEAVQKMRNEKEAKVIAREKRKQEEAEQGARIPRRWLEAREVRMAKELRDMVEETVREALNVFPMDSEDYQTSEKELGLSRPSVASSSIGTPADTDNAELMARLTKLGFRRGHVRSAVRWLSMARRGLSTTEATAASSSLRTISKLSDEDACLEYLAIFCPEDDLPAAFGPSRKADSFVTNSSPAAVQGDALAQRWIEDRLVKLAGYPRVAVQSTLASCATMAIDAREAACTDILLRKLCQLHWASYLEQVQTMQITSDDTTQARADERMALEAVLGPERVRNIPTSERALTSGRRNASESFDIVIAPKSEDKEDIRLRICPGDYSLYPTDDATAMPSFYVVSNTLPAYLRLALTRRMGRCLSGQEWGFTDWGEILAAGQGGVILAMVEELESCWRTLTDDPPELSEVMQGVITPSRKAPSEVPEAPSTTIAPVERKTKRIHTSAPLVNDARRNAELKALQAKLWQSDGYKPIKASREQLPAMASRERIVAHLEHDRMLIIAGETGCGKTTQCPQFVLDDLIERGQGSLCNIIVTQPRRLSAMGVASRVAQERCEALDGKGTVGYAIRGESRSGRNTRLLFTTTGVLLRRLSTNDPDLRGVSHVFVDEVHERGVESDLLLLELREVLKRNRTLRVVLMSATIERETFTNYFSGVPTLDIPGRTFPVTDFYLDDIRRMLGQGTDDDDGVDDNTTVHRAAGIDYDLIGQTVEMICRRANDGGDGAILVFLPGVGEIRQAMEGIQRTIRTGVEVLPLHANLSPDEQRRVFRKASTGRRKVIVSTNVAETSITIDDVVYVVDAGLVKETRYDVQSGLTKLVETRCSQANARQRRGRAGRVRAGECFRLYTRGTEKYRMAAQQVPEMVRMSLENLVLSVKALKGDTVPVEAYLRTAISPPSVEAIGQAVQLLGDMSVLLDQGRTLSALGRHVALLPLDVRLAKLLVLACVFHCVQPMLTVAAILSSKPLFNAPYERRQEASTARQTFRTGMSDILTDVQAYERWDDVRHSGAGHAALRAWCEAHFVSASSLRDIASVRGELLGNLIEMGFVPASYRAKRNGANPMDVNAGDVNLQRALLLAALYPSVVRIAHPQAKYDKAIGGTVEREAEARQVRFFDVQGQRVFLHPSSVLFSANRYSSDFLACFRRSGGGGGGGKSKGGASGSGAGNDKIYLRDATEVPTFALLLFGGPLRIHRREGGISMGCSIGGGAEHDDDDRHNDANAGSTGEGWIRLRANGRIASLINQLRFLLDAAMARSFDDPTQDVFAHGIEAKVRDCLHRVLARDGQA